MHHPWLSDPVMAKSPAHYTEARGPANCFGACKVGRRPGRSSSALRCVRGSRDMGSEK